jgi:hypothetical protein
MAAKAPSSPVQTARETVSSASMATTTSAPFAASPGVSPTRAPASASGAALSALRFQTDTSKPAASSCFAMPEPMIPRPSTATFIVVIRSP